MKIVSILAIAVLSFHAGSVEASDAVTPDEAKYKSTIVNDLTSAYEAVDRSDFREAADDVERAARLPGAEHASYDIWFLRSEVSLSEKRYDEAIDLARKANAVRPGAANPHIVAASAFGYENDLERSETEYVEAAKLNPELLPKYVDYAMVLETKKRRDSASAALFAETALAIDPTNQKALDIDCDAAYDREDGRPAQRADALKRCNAAIATGRTTPSSGVVFVDRASLEQEAGLYAKALSDITEGFALQPNPARSAAYYVRSYVRTNPGKHQDLKGALVDVDRAISMLDAAEYHWLRANIYERLADWTRAKSDFEAYGRIYPPFEPKAEREVAKIDEYLAHPKIVVRSTPYFMDSPFGSEIIPETYDRPTEAEDPAFEPFQFQSVSDPSFGEL